MSSSPQVSSAPPPANGRRAWRLMGWLVLILGVCYLALQNGRYATGSGDDAFYLAAARNLARGDGFTCNGGPVVVVPPGWPAFLALEMLVSPTFLLLQLVSSALLLTAAAFWYLVLLRLTTPGRAFAVMLAVGLLFTWHRYAQAMNSEPLFYAMLAGAVLLACQIEEGRPVLWRAPLLILLCGAFVWVRWAGLMAAPLPASVLVSGQVRPRWDRRWLIAAAACAAIAASFAASRQWVRARAERAVLAGQTSETVERALEDYEQMTSEALGRSPRAYAGRALATGVWLSHMLWTPVGTLTRRLGADWLMNVAGWVLFGVYVWGVWPDTRSRRWIWAGALMLCGALIMTHSRPVGRYITPVMPLLVLGIWRGFDAASARVQGRWRRAFQAGGGLLVASVIACHGAVWAAGVVVAHLPDSDEAAVGGEYAEVLGIARFARESGVADGELAFCLRVPSRAIVRVNNWTARALHLMTDRLIAVVPRELCAYPPSTALHDWARQQGVRFVLMRSPYQPRRLWHFRLPTLAESGPEQEAGSAGRYYALYAVDEDGFRPVTPPAPDRSPRRMPGL